MADVNIGLTGAGEKPPPLTLNNVLKAVEGVKNWKHLGLLAYGEAINSIKRQNDSDEACLKALVEKFLLGDGDYPPSWRAVIYSLDEADEVQLADKIKSFGEPVQDPTLTTDNVAQVIELVNDWDSLSRGFISVIISVIPYSRLRAIQQKYSTKIEISTECASYYVHCNPESSWTHLAIRLYYEEEFAAVVKLKLFLPLRDLTITTKKVNDLFSTMKDEEVHRVGGWLHLPYSKTSEIARIYHRPAQKREAYIDVYINEHPHPTWKELSRVLRVAGLFSQADEVERSYVQAKSMCSWPQLREKRTIC